VKKQILLVSYFALGLGSMLNAAQAESLPLSLAGCYRLERQKPAPELSEKNCPSIVKVTATENTISIADISHPHVEWQISKIGEGKYSQNRDAGPFPAEYKATIGIFGRRILERKHGILWHKQVAIRKRGSGLVVKEFFGSRFRCEYSALSAQACLSTQSE
jgi:hypothetical protein